MTYSCEKVHIHSTKSKRQAQEINQNVHNTSSHQSTVTMITVLFINLLDEGRLSFPLQYHKMEKQKNNTCK